MCDQSFVNNSHQASHSMCATMAKQRDIKIVSNSDTYHIFGFADCHQAGQKVFIIQLAKNMRVIGHHNGNFLHHFVSTPSVRSGQQQAQYPTQRISSALSFAHTHLKSLSGWSVTEGTGKKAQQPTNTAPGCSNPPGSHPSVSWQ